MNQHPSFTQQTRRGSSAFTILRNLAVAAGLAGASGVAPAAEPAPPASAVPGFSDVVLARSVLSALDTEAELRGVNLVVSVVDRVAVIGGAVPSTAVSKRAEQLVRKVDGVLDVRNTCFVASTPDPLLKVVAARPGSSLPPRPAMTGLPGVLTNQLSPELPVPRGLNVAASEPTGSKVVAFRPPSAVAEAVLGAPVGPAGQGHAPTIPAPATAPGVLTGAAPGVDGLLAAARDVTRTEPRFAKLTVEKRNGVLVIGGSAPLASDAWDFARKLQTIPGLPPVAVGLVAGK